MLSYKCVPGSICITLIKYINHGNQKWKKKSALYLNQLHAYWSLAQGWILLSPGHLCLNTSFPVTFLPFTLSIPLSGFRPSSRRSFSISAVYTLCVLWLASSKSLCFIQHWFCLKDPLSPSSGTGFWQSFFVSSLWDGPYPELCSQPRPRLGLPGQGLASRVRRTDKSQKSNDNIGMEVV